MTGKGSIDKWRPSVRQALNIWLVPSHHGLALCSQLPAPTHYKISSAVWRAGDRQSLGQVDGAVAAELAFFPVQTGCMR